ncbi:annexin A7-like isoform X10 [Lineus longissimus]|uniref:annexin A7-like isoform X10 n=1 Tax=Lineus longissimus TaxID=88925 RepID=UPI00315DE262
MSYGYNNNLQGHYPGQAQGGAYPGAMPGQAPYPGGAPGYPGQPGYGVPPVQVCPPGPGPGAPSGGAPAFTMPGQPGGYPGQQPPGPGYPGSDPSYPSQPPYGGQPGGYGGSADIGFGGVGGSAPGSGSTPYPASPYNSATPSYGSQPAGYGAPGAQPGYGAPGGQPGYGAPGAQPGYGAPGAQPGYGAPGAQTGYGAPGGQPSYGAQPPTSAYQQPAQQPPQTNVSPYVQGTPGQEYSTPPAVAHPAAAQQQPPSQPQRPPPPSHQPTQPSGPVPTGGDIAGLDPDLAAALGKLKVYGGMERYEGTMKPAAYFNEEEDVMKLRKAMRGAGTDEKAIIDIVANRSNHQRQQILSFFKTMVGKDLIKELRGELSGNFEECMIALFRETTFYDAYSLRKAIKGAGTDELVLIEILCTRTNSEIREIKRSYKENYMRDLEKDIEGDTSGHFKRLLISCCQANRQELTNEQWERFFKQGPEAVVDRAKAQKEAQELYQAGEKKLGTDEATFLRIMALRHCYQLKATFEEYTKISGRDILNSIKREMSSDLQHGFEALVMSQRSRPEYFADRLYKAMIGAGTDDSSLIRIVVSRSEIDLKNIKQVFLSKYKKTLWKMIEGDTSGDYKAILISIVGRD